MAVHCNLPALHHGSILHDLHAGIKGIQARQVTEGVPELGAAAAM